MKILTDKIIDNLLQIIPNHPALRVMLVADINQNISNEDILIEKIFKFIQDRDYEFQLNLIRENSIYKDKYSIPQISSVRFLDLNRNSFMLQAKLYDFVYISANIEDINDFSKKIYKVIKGSGIIIIFIDKRDRDTLYRWREELENNFFVAINTIDISDNFEILSAKKMHGWGG